MKKALILMAVAFKKRTIKEAGFASLFLFCRHVLQLFQCPAQLVRA
jgi:hypothetical protein